MTGLQLGLRFTTGQSVCAAVLGSACISASMPSSHYRVGIGIAIGAAAASVVTLRGRRLTGWIAALLSWRIRHEQPPPAPSRPALCSTVLPDEQIAVRWLGGQMTSLIGLTPRPFTPTVVVSGKAHTDDVVNTRLIEHLLSAHCPDLDADVVSAGYRIGSTAPPSLIGLYEQVVGPYPAPAYRRTWILLKADPRRTQQSAQRRNTGSAGLASYLVASTLRIADQLASKGVDARPAASFREFDRATDISFERETWSLICGRSNFTAAYSAPGGPDAWWSARAEKTVTRVLIAPGSAPSATVLLTTRAKPTTPQGFSRLFGGQRAALTGMHPVPDQHHEIPIGSAGVLVGETLDRYPVYMPFDDVDACITIADDRLRTQFLVRSAAAGAAVTLGPQLSDFAGLTDARIGDSTEVAWPNATTFLDPRPGVEQVTLRHSSIGTPRHTLLPIRPIEPREESRYRMASSAVGAGEKAGR